MGCSNIYINGAKGFVARWRALETSGALKLVSRGRVLVQPLFGLGGLPLPLLFFFFVLSLPVVCVQTVVALA